MEGIVCRAGEQVTISHSLSISTICFHIPPARAALSVSQEAGDYLLCEVTCKIFLMSLSGERRSQGSLSALPVGSSDKNRKVNRKLLSHNRYDGGINETYCHQSSFKCGASVEKETVNKYI